MINQSHNFSYEVKGSENPRRLFCRLFAIAVSIAFWAYILWLLFWDDYQEIIPGILIGVAVISYAMLGIISVLSINVRPPHDERENGAD